MKNTPKVHSSSRQTGVIQSNRSRVVTLKKLLRSRLRVIFTKRRDPPLNTGRTRWQRRNASSAVPHGDVALGHPQEFFLQDPAVREELPHLRPGEQPDLGEERIPVRRGRAPQTGPPREG